MAVTTADTTLVVQKWRRNFWREWQRENLFAPYMGNGADAVIHRIYELKDEGEQITIPLVGKLTGNGVSGDNPLVGNEEAMDQYGYKAQIDWWRHAILLNKKQMRKSVIDQMDAARPLLMDHAMRKLRDDIIKALFNVGTIALTGNVNGIYLPLATTAQKNTWNAANSDRVQYGAAVSNYNATFATALLNVDSTNDKLTTASLDLMKRRVRAATDPAIRPIRVEDGREYYVVFVGSRLFRDLKTDTDLKNSNLQARPREGKGMDNNPLFQDGDLLWSGMIIREIPEMDSLAILTGAGAGSIDVGPAFVCGAQAVGYAVGQLPQPTERTEDDYGFIKGRGVETVYGVAKIQKQQAGTSTLKDWGVYTGFFSAVGD